MTKGAKPVCLITGASAGIGAAIATEYAARGWDLALCARREDPMIALAKDLKKDFETTSHIFPVDLFEACLLYTSPSPRDATLSRMPSSA